jgi:2-aminoadipate transaminase
MNDEPSDNTGGFRLAGRGQRCHEQPISYLMAEAVGNPALISLAAGLVDYDTLPGPETAELAARILADADHAKIALQYGTTDGLKSLRKRLLDHIAALDGETAESLSASIDELVISTGSQEMLFLLADILLDPGDIVLTGWPSYFVFTGTLESAGARVRAIDMDEHGIIPDALEARLAELDAAGELPRVKMLYLVTYHQNPTGITLAADRKPAILDIVRRYSREHRILILEDAAYRELTYEGQAPPSFRKFDRAGEYTAVLQTFSKPFAPGLKTGYGLLPRELIEPLTVQKGNIDFGSANLCQHLLDQAMATGVYAHHLTRLCRTYAQKRDAMLTALQRHLGEVPGTGWTRPTGGLYVWLTLPESLDTGRNGDLFRRAIEEGMLYVPGEFCFGPDETRRKPTNTIRLSYGIARLDAIEEGIARLARAIRSLT